MRKKKILKTEKNRNVHRESKMKGERVRKREKEGETQRDRREKDSRK